MSNGPKITLRHLPNFLRNAKSALVADVGSVLTVGEGGDFSAGESSAAGGEGDPTDAFNLERMERQLIGRALEHTKENRTEAAKLLGISRRTLQRKLKEME